MYNCNDNNAHYIVGAAKAATVSIPMISTTLTSRDFLWKVLVRLGYKRNTYRVSPGLYAVGAPDKDSPVLVTANYKLSFDALRKELSGINAWVLVLDTNGVNVWCAAGKGTFGTVELVKRIYFSKLKDIVSHRTIILPQLGAPGVSAHEVVKKTGFKVVYGPVRAEDIPEFLQNDMKADMEMRTVKFGLIDRLAVTPLELVHSAKPIAIICVLLFILNLIQPQTAVFTAALAKSFLNLLIYIGGIVIGCVITPMLLPWIPFRPLAVKGFLLGVLWALLIIAYPASFGLGTADLASMSGHILAMLVITSYLALNFTGSTTYTSFSGVRKEVKLAAFPMLASMTAAILLIVAGKIMTFVGGA